MRRKRLVGTGLALLVGLCALGAAAQVTRREFDALAERVRGLSADVALLKVRMRQLKPRVEKLEAVGAPLPAPPALPKENGELKRPGPAPPDVAPQTRALDGGDKPLWTATSAACRDRPVHCGWCPFVIDRYETRLGEGHMWKAEDLSRWTPPPGNVCPFGITFQAARDATLARLKERVLKGVVSAEDAYRSAVSLGLIEQGDPPPWGDGSQLLPTEQMWDDRKGAIRVRCGAACGGLCLGCPVFMAG